MRTVLCVAEKPSVARGVAEILSGGPGSYRIEVCEYGGGISCDAWVGVRRR